MLKLVGESAVRPGSDDVEASGRGPAVDVAASASTVTTQAMYAFAVLFVMNLLDYVDRYVLSAVLPELRDDFHLTNEQAGSLASFFLISYSLVSPLMGWAGDRMRRTWLLGLGVG